MRKYVKIVLPLGICLLVSAFGPRAIQAQTGTVTRNLEPIVMSGSAFPEFIGARVSGDNNELYLYAYRAAEQKWEMIPYQFDEVGVRADSSTGYFVPDDGLLDENDEFVFMARDAGDRGDSTWIDEPASFDYPRYEIEIANLLNPSEVAWVYLYRASIITGIRYRVQGGRSPDAPQDAAAAQGYMEYLPSATANVGEDTVRTPYYEIAHGAGGFPKDIRITEMGGGNGQDLLDVYKMRANISISVPPFPPIKLDLTEDNIVLLPGESDSVRVLAGPVRVIRELEATIELLTQIPFSTPPIFYYPFSTVLDFQLPEITELSAEVNSGRLSIDLNANATNMKFVSANNPEPGFVVDGNPTETPNKEVDSVLPGNNWIYISGDQGTFVHLFPIPTTVGGNRQLYYKDQSSADNNDTGDKMSYGDTGIDISGGISLPAVFRYKGFYLPSGLASDIGSQIAEFDRMPLAITPVSQTLGEVTAVRLLAGGGVPEDFALLQNHPNPFNPETVIRYRIPATLAGKRVRLSIYNVLGQEVRRLVNEVQQGGIYEAQWDGRDGRGVALPSGIYIYRLHAGQFVVSKKLILAR